jgi:ribosomal protein L11 methylase PrmA
VAEAVPTAESPASASPAARDAGSYRDPAGFVFRRDGVVHRQVDRSFSDEWDAFIDSGLYGRLVDERVLVPHDDVDPALAAAPNAYRVIRPERVELISYPYEWSFGQLKDAALLTLRAQSLAMEAGMTLRDASAYNVQLHRGRPLLIDSLSFERAVPDKPWAPYRQFCEHFLAPLALMARVDIRLGSLLRSHLEGIPLDLAASLLPGRTRLSFGLGPHVHLHARAQRRHADDNATAASHGAKMSAKQLATLIESLHDTVSGLEWEPQGTAWADYADNTSYGDAATEAKVLAVRAALSAAGGKRLWDLGANTGRYSRLAADAGYRVVALDIDPAAVERGYRALRAEGRDDITTLLADITDPSPPLGWGSAERRGLLERIGEQADVILALALVHHLAIGANVPLPMIAGLFARLAPEAIVEFVPKEDAMVQRLLAARRDVFPDYDLDGFRAAVTAHYEIVSETPIEGTARTLFGLRRHGAVTS